ncbi:MAG: pyridoxamine 5'-phosphate oxidase family protein [Minwuia sp.]|uniref:pyridoxamine 5'-phosphate oxidase family protein n=1 Tax=Minwuia sp. TaxID=2493630 RepID=UPI003A8A840F
MTDHILRTEEDLRAIYGNASGRAAEKAIEKLDRHCRHFISLSPFIVLSSASAAGQGDVSPKGDGPGFVRVIDDSTIAIPDRPGNRRIDTLVNIVENPDVAVIFLIPGVRETLRVNGKAEISTDPALLESMAVNGKLPITAIVIRVEQTFLHCAKSIIRSKLWDEATKVDRSVLPSLSRMIADQAGMEIDEAKSEKQLEEAYRNTLY